MKAHLIVFLVIFITITTYSEQIELKKLPNDDRQYEAFILDNKLKVVFIYDEKYEKTSCSISLGVGSLYNPIPGLGLSHLLQHMLVVASKKYSDQYQYQNIVRQNTGTKNSFTDDLQTNYFLQIKSNIFIQALQKLISFFINPLLPKDKIQTERQVVQDQFQARIMDDKRRKNQLLRILGQKPYSRFPSGNAKTLNYNSVHRNLRDFHRKFYSSNLISIVIYSNSSMKQQLLPKLQEIPNKQPQLPDLGDQFRTSKLSKFIQFESINNENIMELIWALKIEKEDRLNNLPEYICFIFEHKGKNSLFQLLFKNQYIENLYSSIQYLYSQATLSLQVKLTLNGFKNFPKVYNIILDYMQAFLPSRNTYEQFKQIERLKVQNPKKQLIRQKVPQFIRLLSKKMNENIGELSNILISDTIFYEYRQARNRIKAIFSQMSTENLILFLSSKLSRLRNAKVQQFYGTRYKIFNLPKRSEQKLISEVFMPIPKNPYIPVNTSLYYFEQNTTIPQKISQKFYLLQDSTYQSIQAGIQLRIYSGQQFQFLNFYARYLQSLLAQFSYPARKLGMELTFDGSDCLVIQMFGYRDVVMKFITNLTDKIKTIHEQKQGQQIYNKTIEYIIQQYENFYLLSPSIISQSLLNIILTSSIKIPQQTVQIYRQYTYRSVRRRIRNLWRNNTIKWLLVGNFQSQQQTVKFVDVLNNKLSVQNNQLLDVPAYASLKLDQNISFQVKLGLYSNQVNYSCATVYYQAGPYSQQLFYKLTLIKAYLESPLYNQLKMLRFIAFSIDVQILNIRGVLGLSSQVCSQTRDPKNLSQQLMAEAQRQMENIQKFYEQEGQNQFYNIKQIIYGKAVLRLRNLESLFRFVSKQIRQKTFYFARRNDGQSGSYLLNLTISDIKQQWDNMNDNHVVIYMVGPRDQAQYQSYEIQFEDIDSIKDRVEFYNDLFYCCN